VGGCWILNKDMHDESYSAYKIGALVPRDGHYQCVPCGNSRFLKEGMKFPSCARCLLAREKKSFKRGVEVWRDSELA
jgi:hypothetical protein